MRNLVIYELENDSSRTCGRSAPGSGGPPVRLPNASLPQLSGLALALGVVVGGSIVTEYAFSYPGIGRLIFQAISNKDYFLLQGIFIFIIIGVLVANFIINIVYSCGSADPPAHAGRVVMSALKGRSPVPAVVGGPAPEPAAPVPPRRRREFLYYALHNSKLVFGLSLELVFVLAAIFGPVISPHNVTDSSPATGLRRDSTGSARTTSATTCSPRWSTACR